VFFEFEQFKYNTLILHLHTFILLKTVMLIYKRLKKPKINIKIKHDAHKKTQLI